MPENTLLFLLTLHESFYRNIATFWSNVYLFDEGVMMAVKYPAESLTSRINKI